MKNVFKFLGIIALVAVIGFSMAACGGDDDGGGGGGGGGGGLTITGLSAYNGKYVFAGADVPDIIAADTINFQTASITLGKINNGSVNLKVWDTGGDTPVVYTGNDKSVDLFVMIYSSPTYSASTMPDAGIGSATVSFTNGVGTGSFVALTY